MKSVTGLLIAVAFAALTCAGWFVLNRPATEPPWPARIQGFSFQPFRMGEDPVNQILPTDAELDADLKLMAGTAKSVRIYGVNGTLGDVPELAERHGIKVTLGAWIDDHREANEWQLQQAIRLARAHKSVTRVLVGNEALLQDYLPIEELEAYLDRAREALDQPVGTAEPWHIWLKHPDLAEHCDFIGVHLLPYWDGVPVEQAVDATLRRFHDLQKAFPNKPIVIAEVGWPSRGRTHMSAVPSKANQALFLRRFLQRAEREHVTYYVMEAFDQPWKAIEEGAVGSYWGVYDVNRNAKFEFTSGIVRVHHWRLLATLSVAVALIVLLTIHLKSVPLRNRGRGFLALVVYPSATLTVWVFYDFTQQYMTTANVVTGTLLLCATLGVLTVLLAEAHEWVEAHWVTSRRRFPLPPEPPPADGRQPKVSIHVPCYNEPPEMVMETLDALARLSYTHFEVLVIDNNTRDEAVWRPVEAHCERLGERFRFFHVAPLEGFKAGALNFALRHTAADASIVAFIDCDYLVDSNWLCDLVPALKDPHIGIVQAPQDYRDEAENAFKAMCYAEYRSFFHVGMITRNERNAIIQHGTMVLVRRSLLDSLEGWAQWCITEDAELGLRILEAGYLAHYTSRTYGRGLMPDTFIDFKKQRFRWACGAMQILKAHARALFARGGSLSLGQRYHFVAGWLPWICDAGNLIFNLAALAWSAAMLIRPREIEPPLLTFSVLPLSFFTFKLAKLAHLYQVRVGASYRQTAAAAIAGLALAHTIGAAVLKGLFTRREHFFRTPKRASALRWRQALAASRTETLIMLGLWLAAASVFLTTTPRGRGPDRTAWIVVLVIQSVPYACSLIVSLVSAFPLSAKVVGLGYRPTETHPQKRVESPG